MIESREQRSRIMRTVRSRDTAPEIAVRHTLRELGHRGYRLHRTDLPGKPDIAFIGLKKTIFVHVASGTGTIAHEVIASLLSMPNTGVKRSRAITAVIKNI